MITATSITYFICLTTTYVGAFLAGYVLNAYLNWKKSNTLKNEETSVNAE